MNYQGWSHQSRLSWESRRRSSGRKSRRRCLKCIEIIKIYVVDLVGSKSNKKKQQLRDHRININIFKYLWITRVEVVEKVVEEEEEGKVEEEDA